MNKRIRALLHLIILCLGVILPSVAPLTQVQAAEFGDVITEMSLKNSSGGDLTQGIDIWETFRVYAKFVLPDNQVHQGDTTKITLPSEYAFGNSSAIELKDSSDNVVANGFLDSTNKTITLTYTNYVEQKSGVQGEFFFYARVDHDVVRQEGDLNGGFTVGGRMLYPGIVHYNGPPKRYDSKIEKSSYQAAEDGKNEVHYNIAINRNMEHYTDVTITDKITSPNFKIMRDSIRVYKIAWRWNNGDWVRDSTEDVTANFQSKITENAAGDGFTIDLGDMDGFGYLLDYKTKADYDLVDGERVSNSATMTYNGGQTTTSAENRSYQIAGGVGEGYVFTIKLHKVNENGENLQGAEFEVVRDRSGAVVGKLTTDSNGNANLGDLLRDDYTIREVTPPTGYDKLTEEIKIGSQDFGTDKSVSREIVNKKTVTEQDVTFKKVDPNGKEIPGAQLKIYKGDHVDQEEAPVADWTSEENTSKVIKLSPGTYTLTEANAPAGYQYVEDITFTVGANGTVALVKKGAEDTVQAAGSILTITDKEDNSPKAITFSKVNLGGTEIAGAQIKIFKGNKAQGQAIESWTSEANQSKEINLEPGTYTFHEEAAPTGYLKVTDITFQVKHDGTVEVTNVGEKDSKGENNKVVTDGATLKVTDKDDDSERDVTIKKVDPNGKEIPGAELKLYKGSRIRPEAKPLAEWTSEANASKVVKLAPGTYSLKESLAPAGFVAVEDIKFTVHSDGTITVDAKGATDSVEANGLVLTVTDKEDNSLKAITFSKVNLGGTEIAGAQIKIFKGNKAQGQAIESWTSEANQSKEINLEPGTYTFHEEAAPTGYLKVTDITFQVKHDGTVEVTNVGEKDSKGENNKVVTDGATLKVTDKDDDSERDVTIKKVDPNGKEIPGAELKLYKGSRIRPEAKPLAEWTSEANASKVVKLAPGTYSLKESLAPAGFVAVEDIKFTVHSDGTITVDAKGATDSVEANGLVLTVTDKEDNSLKAITFSKVNLGGTEIAGAEIKIYKGDKAEGNAVESWTSEAGQSKDINLAPGTYTFHEEAAPTGYLKVTDITFQVNHDGTVEVTNVGEKDAKGESNTVATNGSTLTVTDKDDDLPRKITFSKVNLGGTEIAGAQIKIYKGEKAEGNAVESWTSEAGKSKDINLAPGTYTFHEEAAPTGYLKVTDITFQVKTDGTVEVTNVGEKDAKGESNTVATNGSTVTVTDKDDDLPRKITFSKVNLGGTEIAGAEIKIYKGEKAEGQAVESWTSEAGKSKDINLAPGTYTFHEEAAPIGYLKVTDITFQVKHDSTVEVTNVGEKDAKGEENKVVTNGSTVTVTDKDDDLPRKVTFSKVSLGGTEIAGAQIKIYKGDKAEGNPVESWTSEAGKSKDINLTPGTYTFHEEAAPTGYLKVTDITFQVKHDGTVEVTSVGEKDSKGEENKVVTNGSTVTVTDKDDDLPRKITFSKVNLGGTEIAGAQIKIYKGDKAEGTAVESWTSEANKSKDINLTPGTYTFHEEAAPTGYLKVTDITFQVKHDGTVEVTNVGEKDAKGEENKVVTNGSTVTVTDKDDDLPRKITFSKVNLGGTEIAGAQIKIFKGDKAEGQAVESWTSEAGKSKDINLAPGTYTFHEEAAPTGYLKVTDITFQVKHDGTVEVTNVGEKDAKGEENKVVTNGSTVTVTDKDDDLPRKVTFSKVNLGGTEIAGAEIQIFQGKEATGNPVAKWTSEANKSYEIELAPGVYTFHEAAAPTGYLAVTDIVFQVNLDGTVTVVNADGNTVEYKDGTLVVTDQTKPTGPDKDPSKKTDEPDPKKSNQDKPGDKGKTKKILPFTGTEISFTLLAFGLILIVGCGVYFGIRFKK